jgi:hypothetical protein
MSETRAVIVDPEADFVELVRSATAPFAFEIELATTPAECLDRVASQRIDLVILAVDLPDKSGFELFSKVKGLSRAMPVILATSSLAPRELTLHQKLKVHADDYWDKRKLNAEQVQKRLAKVVQLSPRPAGEGTPSGRDDEELIVVEGPELGEAGETEPAPAAEPLAATSADSGAAPLVLPREDLSPSDLDALIEQLAQPSELRSQTSRPPTEGNAGEREDLAHLRQELDEARRIARASPFSNDFFRLTETVRGKDEELAALRAQIAGAAGERERVIAVARQVAEQLRGAFRLREQEHGVMVARDVELKAARLELARLRQQVEQQKTRQAQELEQLATNLALECESHAETRQRYDSTLAEERQRLADDLQQRLAEQERRLLEEAREATDRAVQVSESSSQEQLHAIIREHARAIKQAADERNELERSLNRRIDELRLEGNMHSAVKEREYAKLLKKKEEEHAAARDGLAQSLRDELARELELQRTRHADELLALRGAAENVRQARDDEQAAALRGLEERLKNAHARELKAEREERKAVIQQLESAFAVERDRAQREQTADLERLRHSQAADQERRDNEQAEARERTAKQHAAELGTLERRLRTEQAKALDELRHQHSEAAGRREAEYQATVKRLQDEQLQSRTELRQRLAEIQTTRDKQIQTLEARQAEALKVATEAGEKRGEDLKRAHTEELARQRGEHERRLASAASERQAQLEALQQKLADQQRLGAEQTESQRLHTDRMQRERDDAIQAIRQEQTVRQEYESRLASMEANLKEARERAAIELAALREEKRQLEERLKASDRLHVEALTQAQQQRQAAIQSLEAMLSEKKVQALAAQEDEWRKKSERAQREREEALAAVRREHEKSVSAIEAQSREKRERDAEEIKRLRQETLQLNERLSALQKKQETVLVHLSHERESEMQALEAVLTERHLQAVEKVEASERKKAADALREQAAPFEKERAELQKQAQQLQQALAQREHQLRELDLAREPLEQALDEAKGSAMAQEKTIEALKREIADQAQTIASLRAMIGDFSAQPVTTAGAASKEGSTPVPRPKSTSGSDSQ